MLEVEINQIDTSPTSLRFGCVVRYGKNGPVRFAVATLDLEQIGLHTLIKLMEWSQQQANRILDSELEPESSAEDRLF